MVWQSARLNAAFKSVLGLILACTFCLSAQANAPRQHHSDADIEALQEPLYNPFVERYVLDELKRLRNDMHETRIEVNRELTDRQLAAVDKAMGYSYDTVTYFFYLIAGVSSLLVIVGWNSLREIKSKVHQEATQEVQKIISKYEQRLEKLEAQLKAKSETIDSNREEIERTRERQSLWLRAGQESSAGHKIHIYDQLLADNPNDVEALSYKADAALELNETQWAISLAQNALKIDPNHAHANYQLACAFAWNGQLDEASQHLLTAIHLAEAYRDELQKDPALVALRDYPPLLKKLATQGSP